MSPANSLDHPPAAGAALHVVDVVKSYGAIKAVDGVTLEVAAGEFLGLLGPNGAGKTTLLSIAAGLSAADSGSVTLDGQSIHPRNTEVRRSIGLAPQELALYPELTARENARFFGRLYGLAGDVLERRINEALAAVQLADRADDRAGAYSGGMKRRLNLALGVLHRPRILFLDEPTAGVDPQSRLAIFQEVRRLNAQGMTIVYTSHYMEEVQALCRRVGIIDGGRLVSCDTLVNLLRLDSSRIHFPAPPRSAEWDKVPGVARVACENGMVEISVSDAAAALPEVVRKLKECGGDPGALDLRPPTLERVFLTLTGHALRD